MTHTIKKYVCIVMVVTMMVLNVSVPMAKAEMISTETTISASEDQANRELVRSFFQRDDLRQALTERGIDMDEAQARVDALSNEEVARLAERIDEMPAGAGALGVVVGAALLVFIILLITDIAGVTDVFPFTKN